MSAPASRTAQVNGFTLHYWDWAGGQPDVVCLHPSGHYGRIWEFVAERLAPDLHVIAPDQRGHGDSGKVAGASAEDYAADVEGLAGAAGLDRFVLAGHSLGARAGMVYAAHHPERVRALVLVGGPHYSTLERGADVDYWRSNSDNMRVRPKALANRAGAAELMRKSYPAFSDVAIQHMAEHNTNLRPDGSAEWKYDPKWVADGLLHATDDLTGFAAKIRCPVLILRAEKSWELTAERMPRVQALFPTAKVVTIEGAVQNLEMEAPEAVAREIRAFVRSA
ncbi:MAG: alpha/beta hydrolase [Chloroflexi bacterium]|nr:alpha/beta hydrolase [Chloroflexota bacterium]